VADWSSAGKAASWGNSRAKRALLTKDQVVAHVLDGVALRGVLPLVVDVDLERNKLTVGTHKNTQSAASRALGSRPASPD
jgi:hypothetical protein